MEKRKKETKLVDPYERRINSLRISVTQKCNFNCFFCHQEGESNPTGEVTPGETKKIVSIAADLGIKKIKITGGEPLLREDIIEIIRGISPYVDEVSMTTNGFKLADKACELKKAGLKRVNISLHSSRPDVFSKITGRDAFTEVKKGIETAVECGLSPVKLNMVVMKNINENDIPNMIKFTKEIGAILQLIEFQPLERGSREWDNYYYDLKPLEAELEKQSKKIVERDKHGRKQYHIRDGGVVEIVRPMHNSHFCKYCTRLRITSDGCLKPCLMREDNHVEAITLLRKGATKDELINVFREAVKRREPYWSG